MRIEYKEVMNSLTQSFKEIIDFCDLIDGVLKEG